MPEGGFLDQKRQSPTSLVVVVAAHAALIAALALSKMELPIYDPPGPLTVKNIPLTPEPPLNPPEPVPDQPKPKSVITAPTPLVPPRPSENNPVTPTLPTDNGFTYTADGVEGARVVETLPPPPPPPQPVPEPVRVQARLKAGIELLPPYPTSEERAGAEGTVVVRLVIGPDGRVKSVQRVSAKSEAFWRATERHALRAWRFNPATVDGRPVETTQTMTVHFKLEG